MASVIEDRDGLVRLIGVIFRRYSRDPNQREASARRLLSTSLALYASHTSLDRAAEAAAEIVADLREMDSGSAA